MDQIVSQIDVKMDELFDLFWEQTLKGIDNQTEQLRSVNCPQFILDNHIADRPILMRKRFEEIEYLLKEEFKNRFSNEQWMDMSDSVPIIPTKLSMYGRKDDLIGFITSNFEVARNQRSFFKDFYSNQCGYTQIYTKNELFKHWLKWELIAPLKFRLWDRPTSWLKRRFMNTSTFQKNNHI